MIDSPIHTTLSGWANFYLVTGSAAAALTGLQFVVQTLLASGELRAATGIDAEGGIAAFGSPTVVHFSLSLLISAMVCAPWPAYHWLRVSLTALGTGALFYSAIVLRRTRRQRGYVPTAEDWIWHIILPVTAYLAVLIGGARFDTGAEGSLFAVAAAALLLICVGIHNAWDTVTYLTVLAMQREAQNASPAPPTRNKPPKQRRRRHR